jgi:hypothetical protein
MSIRILAIVLVTIILSANHRPAAAYKDSNEGPATNSRPAACVVGRNSPPTGFWTWPANTHVSIYLREPDFSSGDVAAVRLAVANWDATATETGSHVRFDFQGLTREIRNAQGEITIVRQVVFDKKQRHRAWLEAHSRQQDQFIDYALILVDPSVRNPAMLTNVVAHEIGHSLGLLDCDKCDGRSTAMGLLKASDESNGIEGPTFCDRQEVTAAYRISKRRTPLVAVVE